MNSQTMLEAIGEGLNTPLIVLDCDFRYIYFNRAHAVAMKAIYGKEAALGQALQDILPAEDWARARVHLARAAAGEDVTVTSATGAEALQRRVFEIIHRPVRDESNAVVGVAVIGHDLTAMDATRHAIEVSERRFRGLVENSADAIGLLAADGTVLYDSPSAPGMLGYAPDEWLGKSALQLIHPDDLPGVAAELQALGQRPGARTHRTFRIRHKSGRWLVIEATATNLLDDPAVGGIVLNYRDVTERVETEQLLRESDTRLREVWETTSDAMVLSTADGTMVSANPAFLRLYGYRLEEVIGESFSIIFPKEVREEAIGQYKAVFQAESPPPSFESVVYRADGSERVVESQATFLTLEGQRVLMLSTIRDITERKAAEKALRQTNRQLEEALDELRRTQAQLVRQERLAAVGQLAAGIAHDFNNILSVILLQTQLGLRAEGMSSGLEERLGTVMQQAGRAANLVQQILDFSRSAVLQTRPLDVEVFFEEQVDLLRRMIPESIQIRLSGTTPGAMLHADPTRLQQFLTNLAINARDAMPDGGSLSIALEILPARIHENRLVSPADMGVPGVAWLRVTIRDTGTGIEPEILEHIFEPFYTTKEPGKGTGLGLAQVYGIVRQHNGYVDVVSEVGQGTTFVVDLPVMERGQTPNAVAGAEHLPLGKGEMILVVEDDAQLRAVLVDTLSMLNYTPRTARDGWEALAFLATPRHGVALVLSDLTMPNMGGQALFRDMLAQGQRLPMVILSGTVGGGELDELMVLGLAGWLAKPPEISRLARLLAEILNRREADET